MTDDVTPQPCPSWCTGEHHLPADPEDGFHHWSHEVAIELTHGPRTEQTEILSVCLAAFAPQVAAAPGPARVELLVDEEVVVELTPDEARELAGVLADVSSRAETGPL